MPRAPLPLDASRITIDLGGRRVLDEVDLRLAPGSFTALTGPSGAGKTTLLWILAGALAPTSGTVRYAGRPVAGAGSADRALASREGVVMVPQGNTLVAPLTGRENIVVPLLVLGVDAAAAGARADLALDAVPPKPQRGRSCSWPPMTVGAPIRPTRNTTSTRAGSPESAEPATRHTLWSCLDTC